MIDDAALRRAFADYAEALLEGYDVGPVLYRLSDQCVDVLGVDGAGVSLGDPDGTLRFVAATDDRASRVESKRTEDLDRPCLSAFRTGALIRVDDLEAEDRWSAYRAVALAAGYRSLLAVPMPVREQTVGALNLYRGEPGGWTADELDVATLLSNMASGYIIMARAFADSRTLNDQLQHALDSRVVIEQAKGVLSNSLDRDVDDVFNLLRSHARSTGTRLHDVAERVVDGALVFEPDGTVRQTDAEGDG